MVQTIRQRNEVFHLQPDPVSLQGSGDPVIFTQTVEQTKLVSEEAAVGDPIDQLFAVSIKQETVIVSLPPLTTNTAITANTTTTATTIATTTTLVNPPRFPGRLQYFSWQNLG